MPHMLIFVHKTHSPNGGRTVLRIRYNITTGDFRYGSLAHPVEEGAELTGAGLGPVFLLAILGVASPCFSTIVLFKNQPFSFEFRRSSRKKDPWKEWGRYLRAMLGSPDRVVLLVVPVMCCLSEYVNIIRRKVPDKTINQRLYGDGTWLCLQHSESCTCSRNSIPS